MKKSKFEYSIMDHMMIILAIVTMPIISLFLIDIGSIEFVKYIGLWMTIAIGFGVVHVKLHKYYELLFEEKENE